MLIVQFVNAKRNCADERKQKRKNTRGILLKNTGRYLHNSPESYVEFAENPQSAML